MNALQKSIWSSSRQSLIKETNNDNQLFVKVGSDEISDDGDDYTKKTGSPYWFCLQCCIVGSLLAGIILAIVLTLWLTNSTATSQTMSITNTSIFTTLTTTTTTTETTTTTTATLPTPAPPCALSAPYSSSALLTLTSTSSINNAYTCYAFSWVSSVTKTVNLTFQFRHDLDSWSLDDVFVYCGATQMLNNGNFETGSLSPWIKTTSIPCVGGSGAKVISPSRQSGGYHLEDNCKQRSDKISQEFMATAGQTCTVSFWLKTDSVTSTVLANVSIS